MVQVVVAFLEVPLDGHQVVGEVWVVHVVVAFVEVPLGRCH